ncbi:MAG: HK97 family phage prohead protease [Litoreibacter sp.]
MSDIYGPELERKFMQIADQIEVGEDATISGYASVFGEVDQGNDLVKKGAYAASLKQLAAVGTSVKLLWQHDPTQPIGVWDKVFEDEKGLYVSGRLLTETRKGCEAAALIAAGAIDGLSIGYRTVKADRNQAGIRHLLELELWEVSLVTFPMLQQARVGAKTDPTSEMNENLAGVFRTLRHSLNAS